MFKQFGNNVHSEYWEYVEAYCAAMRQARFPIFQESLSTQRKHVITNVIGRTTSLRPRLVVGFIDGAVQMSQYALPKSCARKLVSPTTFLQNPVKTGRRLHKILDQQGNVKRSCPT